MPYKNGKVTEHTCTYGIAEAMKQARDGNNSFATFALPQHCSSYAQFLECFMKLNKVTNHAFWHTDMTPPSIIRIKLIWPKGAI